MQESALSVRGKPIYGRHTVSAASRTSFPLPTVAFPPVLLCSLQCLLMRILCSRGTNARTGCFSVFSAYII